MTDARLRGFWHRSGPLAVLAMLAVASTTEGCSCDDDTTPPPSTTSSSSSGTGGSGGTGGDGGAGGTVQAEIDPAAQDVANPLDATPDPDGTNVYFTAMDPVRGTGVYMVPASGGLSTEVTVGDPFVAPFGITISSYGQTLFVADPGSESGPNDADDAGQIFVLPVSGGAPTALSGTVGAKPRSVEMVFETDVDVLYFTGNDPAGNPGVFKISPTGGTATAIASGAPFVNPSGVAVTQAGVVYVADAVASAAQSATILTVAAGSTTATPFAGPFEVGYPVGIALTSDDTRLIVSGLDPVTLTDLVFIIDIATGQQSLFVGDADTDISLFEEPAGLHRARNVDMFAWADSKARTAGSADGTVYTFNF
jgi:hypothetical protein